MIFPSTERGGVEEYNLTLASAAAKEGIDVHIAFPRTKGTASLIQDFTNNGVHYHRLEIAEITIHKLATLRKHLPSLIKTAYLLAKLKPDVVQVTLPYPPYCLGSILACGLLQVPTIVRFGLVPSHWSFSRRKLNAYTWARARNQQWITISENNRRLVCESFQIPEHEVLCIYNGAQVISAANVHQEDQDTLRRQVRQELGVSETSRLALTVGRLEPQKGYNELIPAIPHIIREFPDVRFVWVGEGKQRDYLVTKIREYNIEDKVLFLGYRSDVPRLLKSADIFVFPTHYEGGQSFALAEAMAYGLPIVTSNASGIPEVIEDKLHGLIFRKSDSCDLLEALRWALKHSDEMKEMARNAQLRGQEFSEEKMIQKYLDVWHRWSRAF